MGSDASDSDGLPVEQSTRSSHSKRNPGKLPRKFRKAEREKLKRDQLNELFSDLESKLDLDHPNSGKDSILRETIRLLGELLTQVDNLKMENTTLLSESNYVTVEKNELLDETSSLDAEIKRLQREINERVNCSNSNVYLPQSNAADQVAFPLASHASELTPVGGPVFVMPLHESKGFPTTFAETDMATVSSSVRRPQPRYPSSSDSWASHILTR